MERKTTISVLLTILITCLSATGYCQDIESGIKEVDRPIREDIEDKMKVEPEAAPDVVEEPRKVKAEGPSVFIKEVVLTGVESFLPESFDHVVEEFEGREITFDELEYLSDDIEKEYLKKGVIAACFVSPQDIKNGVVTLQVVEARMGKLNVAEAGYYNRNRTASYWEVPEGEVLEYFKISKSLQFMNQNPDREVKAALQAGEEPGTTDINLSPETSFPFHITSLFDREGSSSTGRQRIGIGGRHNNLLGLDDIAMAGYLFSADSNNVYAYHMVPVSAEGTLLTYGFTRSAAFPRKEFRALDLRSFSNSASVFIHQDIFRKDQNFGKMYIGLEGKDKNVYTVDGTLNRDRLRVLRAGADILFRNPGSVSMVKPEISQGLNFLGARSQGDLSSRGADSVFFKGKLTLRHRAAVAKGIKLDLKTSFQISGEKLTPQEQFSLGGIDSVRGYPFGDYYADNGIQSTAEVIVNPYFLPDEFKLPYSKSKIEDDVSFLVFFDHGYGVRRGERDGEKWEQSLASAGVGLRIRLFDQVYVRLAWGFPLPFADEPLTETAGSRFHFSVDLEEKILGYFADKIGKK